METVRLVQARQNATQGARFALSRMSREIRQATEFLTTETGRIEFKVADVTGDQTEDTISYRLLNGRTIQRQLNGGTWQDLANGVTECTFGYLYEEEEVTAVAGSADQITVALTDWPGFDRGDWNVEERDLDLDDKITIRQTFTCATEADAITSISFYAHRELWHFPGSFWLVIVDQTTGAWVASQTVMADSFPSTMQKVTIPITWEGSSADQPVPQRQYEIWMIQSIWSTIGTIRYEAITDGGSVSVPNGMFFQYALWGSSFWQSNGDRWDMPLTVLGSKAVNLASRSTSTQMILKRVAICLGVADGDETTILTSQVRLLNF